MNAIVMLLALQTQDPGIRDAFELNREVVYVTFHSREDEKADVEEDGKVLPVLARSRQGIVARRRGGGALVLRSGDGKSAAAGAVKPVRWSSALDGVTTRVEDRSLFIENRTEEVVLVFQDTRKDEDRDDRYAAFFLPPKSSKSVSLRGETSVVTPRGEGLRVPVQEPPPSEEETGLVLRPFEFRDVSINALIGGTFFRGFEPEVDGDFTVFLAGRDNAVAYKIDAVDFESVSIGVQWNVRHLFYVNLFFAAGSWEGDGEATRDDGLLPPVIGSAEFEGDFDLFIVELGREIVALQLPGFSLGLSPALGIVFTQFDIDEMEFEGTAIEMSESERDVALRAALRLQAELEITENLILESTGGVAAIFGGGVSADLFIGLSWRF